MLVQLERLRRLARHGDIEALLAMLDDMIARVTEEDAPRPRCAMCAGGDDA